MQTFSHDLPIDDDASIPSLADVAASRAMTPLRAVVLPQSTALMRHEVPSYAAQIDAAGLGWTVSKVPLSYAGETWPGAFGIQRDDNGCRLAVVGNSYTPAQNVADLGGALEAAFSYLPASVRPKLANAGELRGGRRVYLQAQLPEALSDLLKVDREVIGWAGSPTVAYLGVLSSHDGGSAIIVNPTAVRVVCENTFALASRQGKQRARDGLALTLKHTRGNVDEMQVRVGQWLKAVGAAFKDHGDQLRAMDSRVISPARVVLLAAEILDAENPADQATWTKPFARKVEAIQELIESRDGTYVPKGEVTAYSLFQAATAYARHRVPVRGTLAEQSEVRLERVLSGEDISARAVQVLLAA